jgi:hypothetical protein
MWTPAAGGKIFSDMTRLRSQNDMRNLFLLTLAGSFILAWTHAAASPEAASPDRIYPGKWPFREPLRVVTAAPPRQPPVWTVPAPQVSIAETCPYLVNLAQKAPAKVTLGETFVYELKLVAQADVAEVTVVETLPSGVAYLSSAPAGAPEGAHVTWKFPTLNRGAVRTLKLTVKAERDGDISSTVTVSALPRATVTSTVTKPHAPL